MPSTIIKYTLNAKGESKVVVHNGTTFVAVFEGTSGHIELWATVPIGIDKGRERVFAAYTEGDKIPDGERVLIGAATCTKGHRVFVFEELK